MAPLTAFRFFCEDKDKLTSQADRSFTWAKPRGTKPGAWRLMKEAPAPCARGFHACTTVYDSLRNRCGWIFAKVEAGGTIVHHDDKFAASDMRILHVYSLRTVVGLACLGAAMSLKHFEKKNPSDIRPRVALDLALRHVASGRKPAGLEASRADARSAASAAEAAWSASAAANSAASAAASASEAAEAAAEAAWSASEAAEAAAEAAWSASEAAWSAASASASASAFRADFSRIALDYLAIVEKKGEAAAVELILGLIPSKAEVVSA